MQFGVHLPTYWEHYGTSDVQTAVAEAAKAADALGYASVWANDLVVVPAAKLTGANVVEPLITLASLVHLAPRVKLGTSVLVLPQRNALLVAKQAATLDLLSGGRLLLGVGIGHRETEFALLGADFAHRAAVTDEAIEVLRTVWRDPVASYQGRFHRLDAARMLPKPPRGGPPIWVGGNSPGALRRAVRHGDAWLPFMIGLDDFRARVADLRSLCDVSQGGPSAGSLPRHLEGATSGRSLSLEHGGRCPTIANEFNIRLTRTGEPADVQTTYPQLRPSVAGSPDAVARYLEAFRQAGMEYALCAFASEGVDDLLRQLRVFAEEVAPRFAGAGAPHERLHA